MDTIRCAVRKFQHAVRTFTASSDLTVLTRMTVLAQINKADPQKGRGWVLLKMINHLTTAPPAL